MGMTESEKDFICKHAGVKRIKKISIPMVYAARIGINNEGNQTIELFKNTVKITLDSYRAKLFPHKTGKNKEANALKEALIHIHSFIGRK